MPGSYSRRIVQRTTNSWADLRISTEDTSPNPIRIWPFRVTTIRAISRVERGRFVSNQMPVSVSWDVAFGAATDTGALRSQNEDCYRVDPEAGLFLVVDGLGGQAAGQLASETVADALHRFIQETSEDDQKTWPFPLDPALSQAGNRLRTAILVANRMISREIERDEQLKGMAATMSAVLMNETHAVVANVGDCRAYLFRDDSLTQITRDHSWVAEQVRSGLLREEVARSHPRRNLVTRAIAGDEDLKVDLLELELASDDTLLLCSDGLSSMVDDETIRANLKNALPDAVEVCRRLVQAANAGGGKDNITVVVIYLSEKNGARPFEAI
jgi:serine/threonine protein phosphatase PrpC